MSVAPAFGLYASRGFAAGERVAAGANFALDSPIAAGGATLFRQSLWLPVPAACRDAGALRLAAGALALRFAPASFAIETGREDWFTRVETSGNQNVRLEFVWPATVSRLHSPFGHGALDLTLHRADGDRVVEDATQSGRTETTLSPPWIGSPLVVKLAHAVTPLSKKKALKIPKGAGVLAAAAPRAAPGVGSTIGGIDDAIADIGVLIMPVVQSAVVPAITIVGAPTSPRLRLSLEARDGRPETLLWQALLPGEQASVTLPAGPPADEWAAAFEQVLKALSPPPVEAETASPPAAPAPSDAPAVLRLDIESDAPCTVSLTQASLALEADYALLAAPLPLDFDGSRRATHAVPLALPAVGTPASITLTGRLDGGTDAPVAGDVLPGGGRYGLLIDADRPVVRRLALPAPMALAGVALPWHPLSERIAGTLRLLPDGGNGPGPTPLLELPFALDTAAPGWIALRWPAIDLQPQPLWLRIALAEGSGLWLADPGEPPADGWTENPAGRMPLAVAPAASWLPSGASAGPSAAPFDFSVAGTAVAPEFDGSALTLVVSGATALAAGTSGISVAAASPARLVVETAVATVRFP